MSKPLRMIQSSDPAAQRRVEQNSETAYMVASAVVGVANMFGSLMQTLFEAATKERVYIEKQVNIYKNVYYVPAGQQPYHLGFEENPAIKNHRRKNKQK